MKHVFGVGDKVVLKSIPIHFNLNTYKGWYILPNQVYTIMRLKEGIAPGSALLDNSYSAMLDDLEPSFSEMLKKVLS